MASKKKSKSKSSRSKRKSKAGSCSCGTIKRGSDSWTQCRKDGKFVPMKPRKTYKGKKVKCYDYTQPGGVHRGKQYTRCYIEVKNPRTGRMNLQHAPHDKSCYGGR